MMKTYIAIIISSVLGLAITLGFIITIILYRRRRRRDDDPEVAGDGDEKAPSSKELILHLLCFKKPSSRVEPATVTGVQTAPPVILAAVKPVVLEAAAAPGENDDGDIEAWRTACFGPSMLLYTIKEEESEVSGRFSAAETASDGESVDEDGVLFETPCSSPSFYTPLASPLREAEELR